MFVTEFNLILPVDGGRGSMRGILHITLARERQRSSRRRRMWRLWKLLLIHRFIRILWVQHADNVDPLQLAAMSGVCA